uniref:Centromere protein S n=1 Tax=Globisporangium ultimum (strain ATCC 200006 / CBS 805.95 / DAOM BR144) TaxID=431595 RepID=K3WEF0_GLOUD
MDDAERQDGDGDFQVRQAILYAVGSICDGEGKRCRQKQQRERHMRVRPAPSKETIALLGDLAHKQAEVLATELQHFAHHASRKSIKPEDVLLCARKHPSMVKLLQKYQREHLTSGSSSSSSSAAAAAASRRRLRRAGLDD